MRGGGKILDVGDKSSCCLFAIPETPFTDDWYEVKLAGAMDLCGDDGRCADWPIRETPWLDDVFAEFSDSAETNDFSLSEGVEPSRILLSATREDIAGKEGPRSIALHGNTLPPLRISARSPGAAPQWRRRASICHG